MSLKEKGLQGIIWSFGQQFGGQIIQFVVQVILARLLLPAEFGLIGMLAIFIALGNSLMDGGMTASLIRTQDADDRDYSSVFFINIIFSIIVYCAFFFAAPLIAEFFGHPVLSEIIKVYCLSFIIRAFSSIQYARLTVLMDFKTQTMLRLPALIFGGVVGLILAYYNFGVWSLVYMQLTQATVEVIFVWLRMRWRPIFILDWIRLRKHLGFGYKLTLSGIIDTVYGNIYHIIIGKFFSAAQVGFYTRADLMKQLPVNNISSALYQVTYPLFSSIQDDNVRLKDVYKRLLMQVLFWITPVLVISGVLAYPLFRFLMTEKWVPAVPYFQILCLVGIIYPLHSYNLNILKVKGRSDLFLRLEIVKKIVVTVCLSVAIPFGIYGLLWMQFFLSILSFFINSFYSGKMIGYPVAEQIKDIFPILGLSGLIGMLVFILDDQISHHSNFDLIRLILGTLFGGGCYLFISHRIKLTSFIEFKTFITNR
jgi:teichuronic acid exporter